MCPEDVTSQLEEEEDSVDAGAVLLDNDSPSYPNTSPPMYQRRSPPHRSVSESELTRVRPCAGQEWTAFMPVLSTFIYNSSISLLLIPVCLSCSVSCGPHGGIKDWNFHIIHQNIKFIQIQNVIEKSGQKCNLLVNGSLNRILQVP